ncbi:D-alanyl-D-alanine carboxypeptidase [Marivibrio halodurans]|uniref:D-alanyl-D-alanine carboxypeptidase n=1 Tax=Marivibrio halodurans TaxID=2039722 RepID=A0A8J7RXA3_9PROT|nr:D-alanyl-D-alanine carboxypeptidase [Marivibrio halodurans]MBP5856442.1 D-alanyl-D-alanine carboxypeptidase [Marivibrio halodurans]
MSRSIPAPLSLLLFVLAVVAGCAGPPPAPDTGGDTARARAEPVIGPDHLGYLFLEIGTGRVVAGHRADEGFIPASTVKLITAAGARGALAPDLRFVTRLCMGRVLDAQGRLTGDLILVGGGDPTLDMDDLLTLAERARGAGLRGVTGRLLLDDALLPPTGPIAPRQPPDAAYNPPLSALMVAEGARRLEWRREGAATQAWFVPEAHGHGPDEGDDPDEAAARAAREGAATGHRWLPVTAPSLATGRLFRRMLGDLGLEVSEVARAPGAGCPVELARVESAPRDSVLAEMLATSSNPMAELVGLATDRARGGTGTAIAAAARGTVDWLRAAVPGVTWRGLRLPNHSGLDAGARVSPRQMAGLLAHAYRADARAKADRGTAARPFPALLAAGGWDKSLRGRLASPETALRVWAKTGTMHFGIALAGYLYAGDGRVLAFAIDAHDPALRAAYDPVAADPPAAVEARAAAWDAAARRAIDAILIEQARGLHAVEG